MMQKKTVYVTGVAGFLGSHIAKAHLDRGDKVFGCDSFASSDPNSTHLKSLIEQGLKFAVMDVTDNRFMGVLASGDLHVIYNMACIASPPQYMAQPVSTIMTSVVGTRSVLAAADVCGARVVHASTSEVYGNPAYVPQSEGHPGVVHSWGPRSCYDSGKMAAEALCYEYHAKGTNVRVARIFNTYGPNMNIDDGRVVSSLVKQALTNKPMTIYGGIQTRSFCYVSDLIDGLVKLGDVDFMTLSTPVNLGNPSMITINELAKKILEKIKTSTSKFESRALPEHDPERRQPNISVAKSLLGWSPKVTLDEGLDKFIEYVKKTMETA